jgi:hypothetical protein
MGSPIMASKIASMTASVTAATGLARSLAPLAAAALVVGGLGGLSRQAGAQPLTDPKIEKADQLFAEGKALLASNLQQACAKFDESLRYNGAAIGTLMNVALCDEKLGRFASAVAKFTEARDRAKEQGLEVHARAAEERIAALAPEVPHVTIKLTEQLPDTSVLIDDRVVALDALAAIAIDPGERVIVVNAPARLPYRTKLTIARAERKDVVIPALARSVTINSSGHRIGQITTIAGAAAAGTGLGLGLYARHQYNQQFNGSPPPCTSDDNGKHCSPAGLTQTQRARTLGNVGTIIGVAGLVTTGVGVYLWLRSPSSTTERRAVALVPAVGPDGVGLAAVGRF